MAAEKPPYVLRWGILSCGNISTTFTLDLLLDPKCRGASDVKHVVAAAATRNSVSRAQTFLDAVKAGPHAKAYGSYAQLVADADVDIVYVGTPHSHHYQHARLALEAGKNVLCEKAFTVNVEQARILVDIARSKKLFLMEAVWTRYFPLMQEISAIVTAGKLGQVHRVFADLSFANEVETAFEDNNRMVNMDLAGGALLDLGIYSITWIFQFLYHLVPDQGIPKVASAMTKYPKTGSDESTSIIMTFPKGNTHGIATTSLRVANDPDEKETAGSSIRIQGYKGEIQVFGPAFRPEKYHIIPSNKSDLKYEEKTHKVQERGMYWEADECARCLRDGKLESEGLSLKESLVIMEVMDEVRKQNDLVYPANIESTEYPLDGF